MNLSRSLTGALAFVVCLLASLPATAEMTLDPGTSVTFHHHDLLGSPVMVSDHKGRVLWYENTKPYGESTGKKSSSGLGHLDSIINEATSNLGYTGHTVDSSTGLVYMKARHYDPVIGRFYSNDPVGTLRHLNTLNGLQGFNRYAYANNNPYTYTDPDGKAVCLGLCIGTVTVAVSGYRAYKAYKALRGMQIASAIASQVLNESTDSPTEEKSEDELDGKESSGKKSGPHSSEERALQDMLTEDTRAGNLLSNEDANAAMDLAEEMGNGTSDHRGENGRKNGKTENHWVGGEHIHIDRMRSGTKDTHIPTEEIQNEE